MNLRHRKTTKRRKYFPMKAVFTPNKCIKVLVSHHFTKMAVTKPKIQIENSIFCFESWKKISFRWVKLRLCTMAWVLYPPLSWPDGLARNELKGEQLASGRCIQVSPDTICQRCCTPMSFVVGTPSTLAKPPFFRVLQLGRYVIVLLSLFYFCLIHICLMITEKILTMIKL